MVTEEQTAQLFNFVRKKHVKYYDLQAELVDHLASGIEEKMDSDAGISFDDALRQVYASFGIFGFGKIVMEKEAAIYRQSVRIWNREFFHWFKWPKLLASLLLFFLAWVLCKRVPVSYIVPAFVFISFVSACCYSYKRSLTGLRKNRQLLVLMPFKISFFQRGYICGILPFYLIVLDKGGTIQAWAQQNSWAVALWIVCSLLLMVSYVIVYRRVVQNAKQMYPAAFVG